MQTDSDIFVSTANEPHIFKSIIKHSAKKQSIFISQQNFFAKRCNLMELDDGLFHLWTLDKNHIIDSTDLKKPKRRLNFFMSRSRKYLHSHRVM